MKNGRVDSREIISDYIFNSKYSRTKPDGKKETWEESVSRVMQMHWTFFEKKIKEENKDAFMQVFQKAWTAYNEKIILGSQRTLQYGGPQLLKNNFRSFNCSGSYLNRIDFFKEAMELLLSGAGIGFSVQKIHTNQLPILQGLDKTKTMNYVIEDSIEGWSESTGLLISNYYNKGPKINFDYSLIRPEGSYVSGGFKAPGPEPLKICHQKISAILDKIANRQLRPFELHYITCIIANAVISGGIRRSAMISIFDIDDNEMMSCKTGDWFVTHPELCRCNNSVAIYKDTPKEDYMNLFNAIKEYGEPGILFLPDNEVVVNPCGEALLQPYFDNGNGDFEYGWSFCNLCEINGAKIDSEEKFYKACEAAAILGTFQAAYTENLPILTEATRKIMKRDALLGVGITGMADNPSILFNETIQRNGAEIIKKTNEMVAKIININFAARTTVIKPSGNASQLLGCSSGIHAYHFRKYIRNIQANNNEQAFKEISKNNPHLVSQSFWNPKSESVLSFPIELDDKAMVRTDFSTIDFLKRIYSTEKNWIIEGTNRNHSSSVKKPLYHHNVSCTVSVKNDEWGKVAEWIWEHKDGFCGLSFLPETGDLDYPQAPYTSFLNEKELVETYGTGAILSSGLIVDGLDVFNDIWTACNAALGKADQLLQYSDDYLISYIKKHLKDNKLLVQIDGLYVSDINAVSAYLQHKINLRNDWVRRFKKFAHNYFDDDYIRCANCLKHVNIFHQWQKIKEIKKTNWEDVSWEAELKSAGSQVGTACSGGKCEF